MALSQVAARFTADTSQLDAAMIRTQNQVRHAAQSMAESAAIIGAGMAVAGGLVAVALGAAVVKAADFEAQIDRVGAIAGATEADLQKLRKAALDLGASTSKSASEVAIGMEQMAAAGFEVNEIIAAMPGIISAAEASGEDLARVSEVVTAALNGFGLEASEASRIADIMAAAANRSAASVDDMGYAFKYAAPVARQLGFDIEWLAAATAVMADAGLEGSQIGTTLRMSLSRLVAPTKEMQKTFKQMGISIKTANGQLKPAPQILNEVMNGLRGMGQEQRVAAAQTIFGTEAMSGMLTLVAQSPAEFNKLQNALRNSGGEATATAKKMKDNLKGSVEQLQGAFETLQISIGTALSPAIRSLADLLTRLVNAFNALPQPVQQFIAISAAIGAIMLVLAGIAVVLAAALGALAVAEWAVLWPILAVVAGIVLLIGVFAAIGAAIVYLYNRFEWIRNAINWWWETTKKIWGTAFAFIKSVATRVMSEVKNFIGDELRQIQQWWKENGDEIMAAVRKVWNFLKPYIKDGMDIIKVNIKNAWNIISTITKSVWEVVKAVISSALDFIKGIIKTGAAVINGDWKGALNSVKEMTSNIWNNIKKAIDGILKNIANSARTWGQNLVSSFASGINSRIGKAISAAARVAESVRSYLGFSSPTEKGPGSTSDKWAPNFVNMFARGLISGIPRVVGAARQLASGMSVINNLTANPMSVAGTVSVSSVSYAGQGTNSSDVGTIITGNTFVVRNDNDIQRVAREINRMKETQMRSKGRVR